MISNEEALAMVKRIASLKTWLVPLTVTATGQKTHATVEGVATAEEALAHLAPTAAKKGWVLIPEEIREHPAFTAPHVDGPP